MEKIKATFKSAWAYQQDKMNLPVKNLKEAIPFYETIMGFQVVSTKESPHKSAILQRDNIEIGLAENGGDPTQEGCCFEVDNVENAFMELRSNGLKKEMSELDVERHGETSWKVFYVVAPDGLCYWIGEKQN